MEQYATDTSQALPFEPERPEFLKILCILSFICCGLLILLYSIGSLTLFLTEETVRAMWDDVVERNPALSKVDSVEFMHEFGMICVYSLLANIFSLVGVIMMWRLEKMGFFIYVVAELVTNFFKMNVSGMKNDSGFAMVVLIVIDLVFIVLYAVNLKHMNKRTNNTFIQSGS